MRDKNVPMSGPFIIEKALQFAKALGYEEFRGSNGWLKKKIKRRQEIMAKVITGENQDVDDNEKVKLDNGDTKILKDSKPKNIFNADEMLYFFNVCLKDINI
ncbi:hypothetical protein AVEN_21362-1 [Araneus ventricosus]|uniref:HTH CENPB-type domain-containing protein n=1 Tax=Araneus ventricosus TaxID=182803 RepID=A0A4Y2B2G3_ARAVE|nr:hypothetical protein AVEN_21362-1 [Araneus ventricosus]